LNANTVLTTAQDRMTATTLPMTAATATASWLPEERTSASTTTAMLITLAISTAESVERDRLSASASRSVPSGPCGQLIRHTQTRTRPAATIQASRPLSSGAPATRATAPAAMPQARDRDTRRADNSRPVAAGPTARPGSSVMA
jgi:hypothetical protein